MSALRSPRAVKALTLFANIPETVLIALAKDSNYRSAIIERRLPFSDTLFTVLWQEDFAANSKDSLELVTRHLSPAQRQLVLSNDSREIILSGVLDCNVLTPAELDLALGSHHPGDTFGAKISENLFNYYYHDRELRTKLLPHLEPHYQMCTRLRSTTSTDTEALTALAEWIEDIDTREENVSYPDLFIADLEDMLYHRPHLASTVAAHVNGYVHCTLAGARYAADPATLRMLSTEHDYKTTNIRGAGPRTYINRLMLTNVYLPRALRDWEKPEDTECPSPVPTDLQVLRNQVQLDAALRYALLEWDPWLSHEEGIRCPSGRKSKRRLLQARELASHF